MTRPYSHTEQYIAQLKRIEQDISENRLEQAARQLNSLAKNSSHDPRLFLLGSRLAEAAGNADGMLVAARKAHQLAPQWPVATIHLAEVLASRGEAQEAIATAGMALQQTIAQSKPDMELVSKAVTMARRANRHDLALQWLRQVERVNPDDITIRHQLAGSLADAGDYQNAILAFTELLATRPGHVVLLNDRMRTFIRAGKLEQAVVDGEALVAAQPDNEAYQFYLNVARGQTPQTQPASVVIELFDAYAARFDRELVVQLKYKLPRQVAEMIHQWHPDRKGDILDLGCGTGLLGVCLGPLEGVLVGVDLSAEMIAQAARHGVYDKFHQVNLLAALQATPDAQYHVITALDVFIYVGDLKPVIGNAHRILLPGGRLVFSCESGANGVGDYALQPTLRFSHQRSYVERLLEEAGFEDVRVEDQILRYEADHPVQGFLVVARKRDAEATKPAKRNTRASKTPRAET